MNEFKINIFRFLVAFSVVWSSFSYAQFGAGDSFDLQEEDLTVGGDIFTDFNEDLEASQVLEDERFYRYGRFFSFIVSLGLTSFDGNRGRAYEDAPPTYGLSFLYFKDFQNAIGLGLEYSRHNFFLPDPTRGFADEETGVGFVEANMLRTFFSYRYYLDTANLGTAITYSNPYMIGRLEYWYLTNKYIDQPQLRDDTGGGLGFGLGFGLEFPIKIKESYFSLEFLYHTVNFHDKFTQIYQPIDNGVGFVDLTGAAYSTKISYIFNW